MNIIDIITKKAKKEELTKDEIDYFVNNYVSGKIKDYQMSSLLMAIKINGMSFDETYNLTVSMLNSGDKIDLSSIDGIVVDKHSTGGVGDKTSLVVLPIVASLGVKIAKMSGRSLGYTGGTIDKLESIPNFNVELDFDKFISNVNSINLALVSQTKNLVPADKKIYALRDVTGTTESIPLIASSIMSKKLASGSDKILLDVKVGKGAFMKNINDARILAKTMVDIGNKFGKETIAVITNMNYPLGYTIGNSLEVLEAIDTLKGNGEENFTKLCLLLSSYMVSMGKNIDINEAYDLVLKKYNSEEPLNKLYDFIKMQGGNIDKIPVSNDVINIISDKTGFITDIDTLKLAMLCNSLGAGKTNKDDIINPRVGIKLLKQINDSVKTGDVLMKVYTEKEINELDYLDSIKISDEKIPDLKIAFDIIK